MVDGKGTLGMPGEYIDEIDVYVGHKIRERRNELGLSLACLADTLRITYQQIQKYEMGLNRISAGRLYALAKSLDVQVAYFYEGLE
jgi:transcriptional regulator with XRE-family HTH domain